MIASEGLRGGYGPVTGGAGWVRLGPRSCTSCVISPRRPERAQHHGGAHKLHTSQPGVSKQIKLLEDERGFQIFVREGRNLTRITPAGQQVIDRALRILQEAQSIRHLSTELRDGGQGEPVDRTTHTQARYVLPDVIREFRAPLPAGAPQPASGTSAADREMWRAIVSNCAIATGLGSAVLRSDAAACLPLYRTVIVPKGHPLANGARLSFKALAAYPLITYTFSFTGPRRSRGLCQGGADAQHRPLPRATRT